ncbi:radical SAM family heme chaperone HemW [Prosthecodimorpha staleyi]|uniref:Heme chaperone HemW n=1 Tax=Prosthecodimorpha staleyi TaxID=2840188 RepID=A0A947GDG9_9HYPH|nr:radical SAM family heme chaperone HemW [Prosthecodimorpha staleyi]MBT9290837.1 radical SAM family heme chaperone HemW [Prosthecodimorpha staleyi]
MSATEPGFGIYLHWPFCAAKCPYCDFNSHVRHDPPDQARWARALTAAIAHDAALVPGRTVTSVFLGGGTPSLMAPTTVGAVIDAIAGHWRLASDVEITLEANPSSVEAERFRGYRAAGVNRVSLGVQALNDADLKSLGRLHNVEEALKAIGLARATFPRLSFDLIYARPKQTVEAWTAELRHALDFAADHLSVYQLTIEEGTRFADLHRLGKLITPDEDTAADLYEATRGLLEAAGMPAYEVSNHAVPGAECRHNLVYWRYGEYVGIGPGAHGRLVLGDGRHATADEKVPERWLQRVETQGHGRIVDDLLTLDEQGDEYLLMGLRLAEGLDLARFETISGRALDPSRLADLTGHGLVETTPDGRLRATPAGFAILDAIVADLAA